MSAHMGHILVFSFDTIFDSMSYKMSFSHRFLSIDQEMEFDNTIKSTLTNNTTIDMLYVFVFFYKFTDRSFHLSIIAFIEELANSWPSNMVYIVTHKTRGNQSGPICSRRKHRTSKNSYNGTNQSNPGGDSIGKMMEGITCNGCTL